MLCVTLKILLVLKNISLHCVNCSHKKIGATKSHLYCSWDVYSSCNILMQWGEGGAGANKTTVFKLGKKELLYCSIGGSVA